MVPGDRQPLRSDLSESGKGGPVEMVGVSSQPDSGPTLPLSRRVNNDSNGRFYGGVGRSPGRLGGLWDQVTGVGQGGMAHNETFLAPVAWCCCGCLRQCHNSSIHQQRGWNPITHLVPTGAQGVGVGQGTPDLPYSQPHIGRTPSPGGSTTTPPNGPNTRRQWHEYLHIGQLCMWTCSPPRRITNCQCSRRAHHRRRAAWTLGRLIGNTFMGMRFPRSVSFREYWECSRQPGSCW